MQYEQEQQGPAPIPSSYMQNPMSTYGSSIITLTNPENELSNMELAFRCQRRDSGGNIQNYGKPLMNDFGINSVIGQVQALLSRNSMLGNIQKQHPAILIDFLADSLCRDLMVNKKNYGIDIQNANVIRDKIYFQALSSAFLALMRGYEEGDRRFWKGSQHDIRQIMVSEQQKGGILNKLNPFRR